MTGALIVVRSVERKGIETKRCPSTKSRRRAESFASLDDSPREGSRCLPIARTNSSTDAQRVVGDPVVRDLATPAFVFMDVTTQP
jgi:hypothetical protein